MFGLTKKRFLDFLFLQMIFMFYSLAGLISKKASQYELITKEFTFLLILELTVLLIYAVFWQQIIKKFDLSIAYSNKGVIIIWTFIWSNIVFNESVTINNLIGAVIIICGIIKVSKNVE